MNDKQENFIIEQQVISTLKSKIIKKTTNNNLIFCIQKEQEKMKCLHYYNKYLFKQNKTTIERRRSYVSTCVYICMYVY